MSAKQNSGKLVLEMQAIAKSYGPVRVLEGVGLSLHPGEVRCLAGENGSGKSTLIKILSGVVRADAGTVMIGDRFIENDAKAAIAAGLSVIYQDFALFPNLTVWENVGFLAAVTENNHIHNRFSTRRRAIETLARMKVDIDPDILVERLPVASKQLVAIARALANDARIIVMDEPTTALTRSEVAKLLDIVFALKADGVAFLFVSHKIEEVFAVCDSVTVLRDGHVVVAGPIGEFDPARLIEAMSGRPIDSQRLARAAASPSKTMFKVRDLGRRGQFASIDLDLRAGEIISVVGLLGSGRTELALALFGCLAPDEGRIEDESGPLHLAAPADAMAHGIAYVPEDRLTEGLFLNQPIRENIVVSSLEADTTGGIVKSSSLTERALNAVKRLRIKTPGVFPPVVTLSGGNQQRVVLARWMERQPKLLILNGPTVGVDVGSKREIHELLLALSRSGTAVLVVTDDIGEAIALSDTIKVMVKGRIVASFDASDIDEEALYQEVIREDRP